VHGIGVQGAEYDTNPGFQSIDFYNQLRYRIDERTVATAGYSYITNDNSDGHRFSVGVEHSLSARTGFSISAGASVLDFDNGGDSSSPYLNASIRHSVNEQLSITGFASYTQDDFFTSIPVDFDANGNAVTGNYLSRENIRVGLRGTYTASENLDVYAGVSVVNSNYEGLTSTPAISLDDEIDTILYNINVGFRYGITNNLSVIGDYNFTQSGGDSEPYDYTRNRYSIGVQATF